MNSAGASVGMSLLGSNVVDGLDGLDELRKRDDANPTPTTSASSSPSLPPASPPAVDLPPCFAQLHGTAASSVSSAPDDASGCKGVKEEKAWTAPASRKSLRTHNPIRALVDPIMASSIESGKERGDGKDQISLALGDPTAYGNLPPCPAIVSAITDALRSPGMAAGYVNACGTPEARAAIARHHSNLGKGEAVGENAVQITADDVIVANGASGALELALTALLDEDSLLLVPRPGFPLYEVIAQSHGATVVHYDLLPDQGWQCDLDHIESILRGEEQRTAPVGGKVVRGILVNNPSNPTGAVYGDEHLAKIVALAERYRVPIVADEIYGDMTFGGAVFHPMANVAARMGYGVPIITASGLGKQYLVPGWRLGWIVFQDSRHGAIDEVKKGAQRLAQVVLGASHLAQRAIPAVLNPSDEADMALIAAWKNELYATIEKQATLLCGLLDECHGLSVIFPEGAMYAMVKIDLQQFDDIYDDVSFMRLLLEEENIVVLPGQAFGLADEGTHVFRVVFCAPEEVLRTAAERIGSFCVRHRK
ncbi:hypothetical protein ACHAXT_005907 [Thalassiosira profunda]